MQPFFLTLILCVALVVVYPPAALAIFVLGAIVTGWLAWSKACARRDARTAAAQGTVVRYFEQPIRGGHEEHLEIIAFTSGDGETREVKAPGGDRLGRQYTVHYDPHDPMNYAIRDDDGTRYDVLFASAPFFALAAYFVMMSWVIVRFPRRRGQELD